MMTIPRIFFFLALVGCSCFQEKQENIAGFTTSSGSTDNERHTQQFYLDSITHFLNNTVPVFGKDAKHRFYIDKDSMSVGFFIFDLTDSANNSVTANRTIRFIDNHVYHVAPNSMAWAISSIIIVDRGTLRIFRAVNCEEKGDRLESVFDYLRENNIQIGSDSYNRIKNYWSFGLYKRSCIYESPDCDYYIK